MFYSCVSCFSTRTFLFVRYMRISIRSPVLVAPVVHNRVELTQHKNGPMRVYDLSLKRSCMRGCSRDMTLFDFYVTFQAFDSIGRWHCLYSVSRVWSMSYSSSARPPVSFSSEISSYTLNRKYASTAYTKKILIAHSPAI